MSDLPCWKRGSIKSPTSSLCGTERAFTLIELLLVICIMMVLAGLGMTAFNSIGRGSGVRGAVDIASSLALSARYESMSYGNGALLVIDNGNNTDRKLRRMAVLRYTNTYDPSNLGANLQLAGKPTDLPMGVYFLTNYSSGYGTTTLSNLLPGSSSVQVLYYYYDGSGRLSAMSTNKLVFSAGIMDNSGSLTEPPTMLQGRRGFLLRQNGRPAYYQTTNQMTAN